MFDLRQTLCRFYLGFLLLTLAPTLVWSAEIADVSFAESCRVDGTRLELHNVALMRYKRIFKAMAAGLYLAPGTSSAEVLGDVPKHLEIEYFWALKATDIVKASNRLLNDNVDAETLRALKPRLDQMNALYEDVRPGDRYALTYVPGRGTFLSLNGKPKGGVPGSDFAAAYFTIWFGEEPMDVAMKKALLSRRQ